MKGLKLLILLAGLLIVWKAKGATTITAHVWVTNTPAGLSSNIVVNIGSASTRYWTNDASAAPTVNIQITNSTAASATNLQLHLTAYPVLSAGAGTPQTLTTLNPTNTSIVDIYAPENTNITVTFGGFWARVVYETNTYSDSGPVMWPTNAYTHRVRTNAQNSIVNHLAMNTASNWVPLNSTFLRNYTDTNTAQTVGNKTLIGPVVSGGRWVNATNITGTNIFGTNVFLRFVTNEAGFFSGTIVAVTNGIIYGTVYDAGRITNALAIAGSVHQLINGHWTNGTLMTPTLHSATISNGTLVGSTIITGASVNLVGSGVNNLISITATSTTAAVGSILQLARENGISTAVDAGDVLGIIVFTGYGTTGQKPGARIRAIPDETFTDSTAASVLLFETTPTTTITPIGRLHISSSGLVTVSNLFYAAAITNATLRGTNAINGRLDFTPRNNTALANGYNSGVILGTNVYVRMSGPSAAYTNAGFAAEVAGSYHIAQFDNPGLSFTILHDSALDAAAANRIYTGTGALVNSTNNPAVLTLYYDEGVSRWRLISIR